MKNSLTFIILVLVASHSFAQTETSNIQSKLKNYIGEWTGLGWHYHNSEKTNYFTQTCKITSKLDGDILIVEQIATLTDNSEVVIFKELAVWRLGSDNQNIIVEQYRNSSDPNKQYYSFSNGKLIRSMNDGQMEFIIEITYKNEYLMRGFKIEASGNKNQFFEMKLSKIK